MENDNGPAAHLIWKETGRQEVYRCKVLSIRDTTCLSPEGETAVFSVIDAPDWAIVIPVIETEGGREFVMVRQWRHGSQELSLEFPGGGFEPGENALEAAARELQEETAYAPGKIRKIGEFSPNPALMSNRVHFFLAEDLKPLESQDLDKDEFVDVELVSAAEVFQGLGRPPYMHALMASAYTLYLQATGHRIGS
ncbi:MutT/NUDIX family protein [Treponema primitia ZAS-2]|uniref:GDP-mannose pyrophosphatase n=1 Tax=Treponema primitia (strain ATCC BAA-887 / DSM 12427 / ZAS-2) TaxID=545694 RepID=F5YKP0_TREPZ|nr:NUDIX hydrolase [Treponema primitia]AEF87029.1 MutT/NUDIX family protein [Treponema primitia ZAS-2]